MPTIPRPPRPFHGNKMGQTRRGEQGARLGLVLRFPMPGVEQQNNGVEGKAAGAGDSGNGVDHAGKGAVGDKDRPPAEHCGGKRQMSGTERAVSLECGPSGTQPHWKAGDEAKYGRNVLAGQRLDQSRQAEGRSRGEFFRAARGTRQNEGADGIVKLGRQVAGHSVRL